MTDIQIVTDSAAGFIDRSVLHRYPITLVPNRVDIGGVHYREGVDLSAEEALSRVSGQDRLPRLIPPEVSDYAELYARLIRRGSPVISIQTSGSMAPNLGRAQEAARQFSQENVVVVDSQTTGTAMGILCEIAGRAVQRGLSLDDVVREVRGAVDRVFSVYYTDTIDSLLDYQIMSPSHTILGKILGMKPLLSIERGKLTPIEKVKSGAQAIDRLVEFAVEFTDIESAAIVQAHPAEDDLTRTLRERLHVNFPDLRLPHVVYNPSLAALIGGRAVGLVILEAEMIELYNDL
jgi:DegV family protein with EDD domain